MKQIAVIDTPFAQVHSLEGAPPCSIGKQRDGQAEIRSDTSPFQTASLITAPSFPGKSVHLKAIISSFLTGLKQDFWKQAICFWNEKESKTICRVQG